MKNLILALILLFSMNPLFSQTDRNVIWIHGLGGSNESWITNAAHHQATYQMRSISPIYGSGKNAKESTKMVKSEIDKLLPEGESTKSSNIGVSHSFGGLVTRTLEMTNSKENKSQNYGGYLTVHTPNEGAQMAKNVIDGTFKRTFSAMFDKLTRPFKDDNLIGKAELKLGHFILSTGLIQNLSDLLDFLINAIDSKNGDEVYNKVEEFAQMRGILDPAKIADLVPGSDILNELNSFDGPCAKINVWGTEESNIFYRVMSSLSVGPGSKSLDIVSDENLTNAFNTASGLYNANSKANRVLGIAADLSPFLGLIKLVTGKNYKFHENARKWKEGADYIRGGLESDWIIMIGAKRWESKMVNTYQLNSECQNQMDQLKLKLSTYIDKNKQKAEEILAEIKKIESNPSCWEWKEVLTKILIHEATDGVVHEATQKGGGGILFENKNCNHFEALNTGVMSNNFEKIFKFGDNGSFFFKTELR